MATISLLSVPEPTTTQWIPVFNSLVPAGFASLASEEVAELFDMNRLLFRHPEATYLVCVSGESMSGGEIHASDLLAVDKHLEADPNHIVVAVIEGECTVKRLVLPATA